MTVFHPTGLMTAPQHAVHGGKFEQSNRRACNYTIGHAAGSPALWVDAADIPDANGDLQFWSGKIRTFEQGTAGNRPEFKQTGLAGNGRLQPCVETDGVDEYMEDAGLDLSAGDKATTYVLAEVLAAPAESGVGNFLSYACTGVIPTANNAFQTSFTSSLKPRDVVYGSGGTSITNYGILTLNALYNHCHTIDRALAASDQTLAYVDGASSPKTFTANVDNTGNWTNDGACFGALNGGTQRQVNARFKEMVLYTIIHTPAQVRAIDRAIRYKAREL